jgi:hypothetical protein
MGGVFSQNEAFDSMTEILPGLAFHAVAMGSGGWLAMLGRESAPASRATGATATPRPAA